MDQPTDKSTLSSIKPYCLHAKNKLHMLSSREQFNDYLTLKLPQRWLWEAWHQFICDKLVSDSNNAILLYQLISNSDIRSTCTYTHSDPPHTNKWTRTTSTCFSVFSHSTFPPLMQPTKIQRGCYIYVCSHAYTRPVCFCVRTCTLNPRPPPTWWNVSDLGLPAFKPHLLFTHSPSLSLAPHTIIPFPTAPAQEIADLFCIATMNFKWVLLKESSQPLL